MSQKVVPQPIRVRKDITTLSKDETDLLIKAWAGIQSNLPDVDKPDNPNPKDFFTIAGFHGMPFRGAGYGDPTWWGGYCNHGNVLFPSWHRAYLVCFENALQSVEGCANVSMPYWNELKSAESENPIPQIFLDKEYTYSDGTTIKNPLYSYKLQRSIMDHLSKFPDTDYTKYKGYETVRYPFSGLVGKPDKDKTKAHNQLMNMLDSESKGMTTKLLQSNVNNWLAKEVTNSDGVTNIGGHVGDYYIQSLFAPNYTVFSNTTSAQRWNDDRFDALSDDKVAAPLAVIPLEKPHNSIHLAIGGYDIPGIGNDSFVPDANGDMGENDTASFDPIFYFHHCWIDLVFWAWQLKNEKTDQLDIIEHYPGTNSVDNQGPTPGISGGTWLTLDTHLAPFIKDGGEQMTSHVRDPFGVWMATKISVGCDEYP
jgi:tyrosinase